MKTPADVKNQAQVGKRLRLQFCDGYHKDLHQARAVVAVRGDGITLEGGSVVKWSCSMIVQPDGFTLMAQGKPHLQYIFEKGN